MKFGFGKKTSPHQSDARVELKISENKLSVYADFFPALGEANILDREYIEALLEEEKIVNGVDWDKINESIKK